MWPKRRAAVSHSVQQSAKEATQDDIDLAILELQYATTAAEVCRCLANANLPDEYRLPFVTNSSVEVAIAAVTSAKEDHCRHAALVTESVPDAVKIAAITTAKHDRYYENPFIPEQVVCSDPRIGHPCDEPLDLASPLSDAVIASAVEKLDTDDYLRTTVYEASPDNPVFRAAAVRATDSHSLRIRALKDADVSVRLAALEGITAPSLIATIAKNDPDPRMQEAARAKRAPMREQDGREARVL